MQLRKSKPYFDNGRTMIARIVIVAAVIAIGATLVLAGHELINYLEMAFDLQRLAREAMLGHPAIIAIMLLYIVLIAIPFVPGIELGLMLLVIFGVEIAVLVYLATVAGMALSFIVGRLVPTEALQALCVKLGLVRVAAMLQSDTAEDNGAHGRYDGTHPWLAKLLRYRSVSLALLINTPGNTVIGGGGGIAMAAGISRLFTFGEFLLTVSVAVAPVPLIVLFATWLAQ